MAMADGRTGSCRHRRVGSAAGRVQVLLLQHHAAHNVVGSALAAGAAALLPRGQGAPQPGVRERFLDADAPLGLTRQAGLHKLQALGRHAQPRPEVVLDLGAGDRAGDLVQAQRSAVGVTLPVQEGDDGAREAQAEGVVGVAS